MQFCCALQLTFAWSVLMQHHTASEAATESVSFGSSSDVDESTTLLTACGALARFLLFTFLTQLYFTMYGIMAIALTPALQVAAVASSALLIIDQTILCASCIVCHSLRYPSVQRRCCLLLLLLLLRIHLIHKLAPNERIGFSCIVRLVDFDVSRACDSNSSDRSSWLLCFAGTFYSKCRT